MTKKPIFKTDFVKTSDSSDPETLFYNLRGRAPEIKHLWSHQADLLREYHKKFCKIRDVAIELPTGSGKTLVGLLIGEWRRRNLGDRVAYLCPTRQLAQQVGKQAHDYGIQAHVLIGRQSDYNPKHFSEYKSSQAIAITTYSAIFNINPRICDAQTLILDDAHAGEGFISSMWSVEILRSKLPRTYHALVELLRDELETGVYADLKDYSKCDPGMIELVPSAAVRRHRDAIRDLLNEHLEEETPPWYAWSIIKDRLVACNCFVSCESILIRPLIPPTRSHDPFGQAKQRVYMSATLGAGGELERIAGIKSIERLPAPAQWEKKVSGRRLFLIPELELPSEDMIKIVGDAVQSFGRSLVLVPSQYDPESRQLRNAVEELGITMLEAQDIEDSIDPFLKKDRAVLVLSRYDGLDLPDEACRLLVVAGLPSGTNLQEKFLWSRIGACSLLRDRIITRFTQGVGRCTRSDNDYAVVFLVGRRLVDFLLKRDNRGLLNPELQAELEFGIENSKNKNVEDFRELWEAFLSRDEEWQRAEEAIGVQRDRSSRVDDPTSERLRSVVTYEVEYLYAMWRGDFETALKHARKVADALGGDETKAYRAWWYYLSAEAAMLLYEETKNVSYQHTARDLLERASRCCTGVSWFARLARSVKSDSGAEEADELTAKAVERIRDRLVEWGAVGKRFEQYISEVEGNLGSTEHKDFHRGLKGLGEMLGFKADLPEGDGAPDCVWSIGSAIYVVYEAKSEHTPNHPIGVNDIRQAQSHENWIRDKRVCNEKTKILCIIASPRDTVAREAVAHGKDLYHVTPSELKDLFEKAAGSLRRVRAKLIDLSNEKVLEEIFDEYTAKGLDPKQVIGRLSQRPVTSMVHET